MPIEKLLNVSDYGLIERPAYVKDGVVGQFKHLDLHWINPYDKL